MFVAETTGRATFVVPALLAAVVADHFPGVSVQRAAIVEPQADIYHGDPARYAALLQRHGIAPEALGAQVAKTIDYLYLGQ